MPRRPRANSIVKAHRRENAGASYASWSEALAAALIQNQLTASAVQIARLCARTARLTETTPEHAARNVIASASALDMPRETFLKMALRQGALFYQKPESLKRTRDALTAIFAVESMGLQRALEKYPALLIAASATIGGNIERLSALLDVSHHKLIAAALRGPQVLCMDPGQVDRTITETARALDLEKAIYVQCALKQPPLFYAKPANIVRKVSLSADLLELERAEFIAYAVRQPSLFYAQPETLGNKRAALEAVAKTCSPDFSLRDALNAFPGAICFSVDNLELRQRLATVRGEAYSLSSILTMSAPRLSALLQSAEAN